MATSSTSLRPWTVETSRRCPSVRMTMTGTGAAAKRVGLPAKIAVSRNRLPMEAPPLPEKVQSLFILPQFNHRSGRPVQKRAMTGLPPITRGAGLALPLLLSLSLACVPGFAAAGGEEAEHDAAIVHALNRLTYGPRPGDLEAVRALGLSKWIDRQLRPERIADPGIAPKLAALETNGLSTAELIKGYELPREARKEAQRLKAEMESASDEERRRSRREFVRKYAPEMAGEPRLVLEELQQAKLLRALYSERQLDEVLVDFWMNHFNVYAQKGPVCFLLPEYEREVIRPRVFGRFEDLLLATAESPAMLFYLDNWLSADPSAKPQGAGRGRGLGRRHSRGEEMPGGRPGGQRPKRGLNENYAREIMELHTLGVDGGYTQKDVTEVARCFTGWTIRGMRDGDPEFAFDARVHDKGEKVVLGQVIKAGGREEGRKVIHLLATHPATARFVSTKLARKLVADEPPASLVDKAAETFRRTEGDLRAVVALILQSPEFLAPATRAAKVKTPLEFVASAVRASGAAVESTADLARRIGAMGMPLYLQQPPTGYKDTAEAWVSTSGLLARLNFALDLAAGRVRGVTVDPSSIAPGVSDGAELADVMALRLLPAGLSDKTRQTLEAEAGSGQSPARVAGLILGSPEFQRR
jgi:uncharacterized protein (DUF1800 family)